MVSKFLFLFYLIYSETNPLFKRTLVAKLNYHEEEKNKQFSEENEIRPLRSSLTIY